MYKKHFYTAVILLLLAVGIQPALADILVPDQTHVNGTQIATWNPVDRIYTLIADVSGTLILSNPGWDGSTNPNDPQDIIKDEATRITFDGGGNTVRLDYLDDGIEFGAKRGYFTIQNLSITNNVVGSVGANGIEINTATRINVINTNISNCQYGIAIGGSGTCIVKDNTISDCTEYGIWLSGAVNNKIYNNNFINNYTTPHPQAYVTGGSGNVFHLDLPIGGNYWSDWSGSGPYVFDGGQDESPWISADDVPYFTVEALPVVELIATVKSMNLQQGIDNSLDAKLNAALNALDDINQNNDVAAINTLNAFINAVEDQRGAKLTDEQADELIAQAQAIIDMLSAG